MKTGKSVWMRVLCLLLCGALMAGCAGGGQTPEETTLPLTMEERFELAGYGCVPVMLSPASHSPWPKDETWYYTGNDHVVELPGLDATLTMPESWAGRVEILQAVNENGSSVAYVSCRALMDAVLEMNSGDPYLEEIDHPLQFTNVWCIFILRYVSIPKDYDFQSRSYPDFFFYDYENENPDPRNPDYAFYLGENETHYFYAETIDTQHPECSSAQIARGWMINGTILSGSGMGDNAYAELIGDLVATPEQAREMISIRGIDTSLIPNE